MNNYFNCDSKFSYYGSKFADLVILNILTILCSLFIFTIGAAFSAMYKVVLQIRRNEESNIIRTYFKAFLDNIKQGTVIWLIYSVVIGLLGLTLYNYIKEPETESVLLRNFIIIGIIILTAFLLWSFILQSRYQNTVFKTIFLSVVVSLQNPLYTIIMIIYAILPVAVLYFVPVLGFLVMLSGITLPAIAQAMLFDKIFNKLEGCHNETASDTD